MLTRYRAGFGLALVTTLIAAAPAAAQSLSRPAAGTSSRPVAAVEFLAGHAGFADDATIEHSVFGGAGRFYLTPRLAVGPEVVYMRGPGRDRDLFLTGNLNFDLRRPRAGRPPLVSPFLVAGAGFFRHTDRFGAGNFASSEGAFTAGGGSRFWIGDRAYALVDFRIGWELHYRVNAGVGIALGR